MSRTIAAHKDHGREVLAGLTAALDWSATQIAAHRDASLRALLRAAVAGSSWHRERLGCVDLAAPFDELLASLPTMTKADLVANFDAIVTVPGLDTAAVEANLAGQPQAGYLPGGYTVIASSGSSGMRATYAYGWTEWAIAYASCLRRTARSWSRLGTRTMAVVAAGHPTHASAALQRCFGGVGRPEGSHTQVVPASLPLHEQVALLDVMRPESLAAYPSSLHRLALEALAGRLAIRPHLVQGFGEALLPETRALAESAWGVPVGNIWGTSEACGQAESCDVGRLHLSEDIAVCEPVDAAGRPIPPGGESAMVLVTNLYNHTMPLIRYELGDQIRVDPDPCPCGSAYPTVAEVAGRLEDWFDYAGIEVHPHLFRSPLSLRREIVEYQVRQTAIGAEVCARTVGTLDAAALAADLQAALARAGLPDPWVEVRIVDDLPRGRTGKLARFVPLRG
ncbi:MAG: phenylacetate--CoA ligase family protein [Sporichthyaceae bacterium]